MLVCINKYEPDQIATQYFTRKHKKLETSPVRERNAVLWKYGVITGREMCFNFCLSLIHQEPLNANYDKKKRNKRMSNMHSETTRTDDRRPSDTHKQVLVCLG